MFRISQLDMFPVPTHLLGESEDVMIFGLAEIIGDFPVWLLRLLPREDDSAGGEIKWRRIVVHNLLDALAIAGAAQWSRQQLYALLPERMTGSGQLTLSLCRAVWECQEPEIDEPCWRVETDRGMVLESVLGTGIGAERGGRLVWRAA